MNIKYQLNKAVKAIGLMAAMLFAVISVNAQCNITTANPPCVGQPINFFCNTLNATNYSWDFGDGGTNTTLCNPSHIYAAEGTYNVTLSLKLPNGSTCSTSYSITIKGAPKINIHQLTNDTSCFFGNSFCFVDSTLAVKPNVGTGCIKSVRYLFSDGDLVKASGNAPNGVNMPFTFCKSFFDPAGGTYDMLVEIEDCNGCISRKNFPGICVVRASMGLSFSSPRPKACDSVLLTVTNNSLIALSDIDSFRWDWGDGTYSKTGWKPTSSHWFKVTGPVSGNFNTKLTVWSKFGCKESFTFFSSATNIILKPRIVANRDSVCVADQSIDFSIQGGSIPQAVSPTFNFGDPMSGPLNTVRQWAGTHAAWAGGLGPYKIKFTYSHPICGNKEIYDTIMVLGPVSTIEKGASDWLTDSERYQCVITDSVRFKNFSTFYHNDKDFTDDDSVFVIYDSVKYDFIRDTLVNPAEPFDKNYMKWLKGYGGFNAPLTHIFNSQSGQTSVKAKPANVRGNSDCVFRLWDFDDDFCDKCTTDTKHGINTILKNCKYSKDSLPVHWYTPWDSIYQTKNSLIAAKGIRYNKDSGLCYQVNIWPDDSMAIIRDTILYYGDNPLGINAKDSIIYNNIKVKVKVPSWMVGPAKFDATSFAPRFYLRRSDTVYIDNNNGFPPNLVRGTRYQTLQIGQTLILTGKSDTARFNHWIVYIQDTIANHLVQPWHKVWRREAMRSFKPGDSVNAPLHRQKFYDGTTVRCFNVRLFHKDMCHPMQCEHQATSSLALMPPSAKKLRRDGISCLGANPGTYGITFILDDTKPGCSRTFAKVNYDTALSNAPSNWKTLIGPNLSAGGVIVGGLPLGPVPYLGYVPMGPAGSRFSTHIFDSDFKDSITGYINVGLIVGNGIWRTPTPAPDDDQNYPASCLDTIYYPKFTRFPVLDGKFRIVKPKEGDAGYTKICRRDSLCMTLMPRNRTYIPDVNFVNWKLSAANVGKYYDKYYTIQVEEYYERFKKDPSNPNHLLDILHYNKFSYFDNNRVTLDSFDVQVAEVTKWHTEADITPVFTLIQQVLKANNIDVYDLTPTQLSEIIWNGIGKFGVPYTGSRGCLDTTGFGKAIRFYKVADQKNIQHFRDTSLLPMTKIKGWDGKDYNAYCFVPNYSGYYVAQFGMRSNAPENCSMETGKKVIVGFFGRMDYTDTILCHGADVSAYTEFKYFHTDPDLCNCLLDPTDYWYDRRSEAGNPNREGRTRWDLSKADDDITVPNTIFGPFPYGQTGVGTGNYAPVSSPPGIITHLVKLGGIAIPGAKYYLSDTGGYYNIRVASGDSTGCRDTFPQDIFVTSVKAKFGLGQTRPECKSIIEFLDSSFVYDPCLWKLKDKCDYIVKWSINWGDSSRTAKNVFTNSLPPNVGHDYTRNGHFKVILKVETHLGCVDLDTVDVYIPGPIPFFDTFIPRKYCVNELVSFTNLSKYVLEDSSIWTWIFGYGGAQDNQYDTIITGQNDTIGFRYPKPGRYYIYLYQTFNLKLGTNIRQCTVAWPDTTNGQMKPFYVDVFPYDSVTMQPRDTSVCLNMPVTVGGHVQPYLRYSRYVWNLGKNALDTSVVPDTVMTVSYGNPGTYMVKFKGDRNSVNTSTGHVCPGEDSIRIIVADVKADFDIDTSDSPVYCFENKSSNSIDNRWSLYNKKDVMTITPASDRKLAFHITGAEANAPKPCSDYRDSLGAFWVCLEATNATGCKDTVCKLLINRFEASIRPPNVFTPDNGTFKGTDKEGLMGNDVFNIEIKGEDLYELVIYDRWGVKVFESKDKNYDWNGKVNNDGKECPDGNYFYILHYRYKGLAKEEPVLNGTVQIIR